MYPTFPSKRASWALCCAFLGGLLVGCGNTSDTTSAKDVPASVLQDETRPLGKPTAPKKH